MLVSEVEEILKRNLESSISIILKGFLEIILALYCNFWGGVIEGAEPYRKDLAHMWSKSLNTFLDEVTQRNLGCLSDFLVYLVHQDSAIVVQEEC